MTIANRTDSNSFLLNLLSIDQSIMNHNRFDRDNFANMASNDISRPQTVSERAIHFIDKLNRFVDNQLGRDDGAQRAHTNKVVHDSIESVFNTLSDPKFGHPSLDGVIYRIYRKIYVDLLHGSYGTQATRDVDLMRIVLTNPADDFRDDDSKPELHSREPFVDVRRDAHIILAGSDWRDSLTQYVADRTAEYVDLKPASLRQPSAPRARTSQPRPRPSELASAASQPRPRPSGLASTKRTRPQVQERSQEPRRSTVPVPLTRGRETSPPQANPWHNRGQRGDEYPVLPPAKPVELNNGHRDMRLPESANDPLTNEVILRYKQVDNMFPGGSVTVKSNGNDHVFPPWSIPLPWRMDRFAVEKDLKKVRAYLGINLYFKLLFQPRAIRICANKYYIEDLENPRPKEDHLFQSSLNRAYAIVSQWVDDVVTKGEVVPLVDWLSTRCEIENHKGDNRRDVLKYAKRWRTDDIRDIMHAQVKNPAELQLLKMAKMNLKADKEICLRQLYDAFLTISDTLYPEETRGKNADTPAIQWMRTFSNTLFDAVSRAHNRDDDRRLAAALLNNDPDEPKVADVHSNKDKDAVRRTGASDETNDPDKPKMAGVNSKKDTDAVRMTGAAAEAKAWQDNWNDTGRDTDRFIKTTGGKRKNASFVGDNWIVQVRKNKKM
jgi:hypothetical protein